MKRMTYTNTSKNQQRAIKGSVNVPKVADVEERGTETQTMGGVLPDVSTLTSAFDKILTAFSPHNLRVNCMALSDRAEQDHNGGIKAGHGKGAVEAKPKWMPKDSSKQGGAKQPRQHPLQAPH